MKQPSVKQNINICVLKFSDEVYPQTRCTLQFSDDLSQVELGQVFR